MGSVCQHVVENISVQTHQGYWFMVCFFTVSLPELEIRAHTEQVCTFPYLATERQQLSNNCQTTIRVSLCKRFDKTRWFHSVQALLCQHFLLGLILLLVFDVLGFCVFRAQFWQAICARKFSILPRFSTQMLIISVVMFPFPSPIPHLSVAVHFFSWLV